MFAAFISTLGEGSFVLLGASNESDVAANLKAYAIITIFGFIAGILFGFLCDILNFTGSFSNKDQNNFKNKDLLFLVQATSPFTQSKDFKEALETFRNKKADSLLTCIKTNRFFWRFGQFQNFHISVFFCKLSDVFGCFQTFSHAFGLFGTLLGVGCMVCWMYG